MSEWKDNITSIADSIKAKSVCYDSNEQLMKLNDEELQSLVGELYDYWFDTRAKLDEQMLVDVRFSPNYYIYEANEAEAKAKFLFVKAYQMLRQKKVDNP